MNTQPILTPKETSSPQRHGRRTSRIQAPICLSLLIAIGAIPVAANTLYLTGFNNNASQQYSTFAIDTVTGQVTNQWPDINSHDTSNFCCGEFAIAVDKTIRKIGISNGERWSPLGSQYTLKGTFTGTTYSNPLPVSVPPAFSGIFDATTDGVHNYFVDVGSGTVYRTDRDYTNPVALFTAPGGSGVWEGISYDPSNDSLWLSQGGGFGSPGAGSGVVADFSLSGSLLSFFSTGHGNTALAFDPEDGTIWLNIGTGVFSGLEHYSTEGVLLGTLSLSLPPGVRIEEVSGGEFAEAAGKTHKKQKGGPKPTKP